MSYLVCQCGVGCFKLGTVGEPCWGQVGAVDEVDLGGEEGYAWIHACRGHYGSWDNEPYVPERTGG